MTLKKYFVVLARGTYYLSHDDFLGYETLVKERDRASTFTCMPDFSCWTDDTVLFTGEFV